MWICPLCQQKFLHQNQNHSCNDRTLESFLEGKSEITTQVFNRFVDEYRKIGDFVLHPAKSKIGFAAKIRFCSIINLGKNYIDVVFHLNQLYEDNLCFHKMGQIPGSNTFNHHCRIFSADDINDELKQYMLIAYDLGIKKENL
ncbi:hypothetical protein C3K47_03145 [Solitalea longa]|uniref:DUF5655 domain-containing protein n=1 Tax=Solitalea longa TaxID=2079460 RepID=A0A2S5A739_9SPHI|nr:DUF5655 domain-containing protein [Solitalea longa]POY38410.1 hypothetical protein C3K47_03145 [Solitalea longa]